MSEESVINDIFDKNEVVMPVAVELPQKVNKKIVSETSGSKPAYTVIQRNSLTDTEYAIYRCALDGIEELRDTYASLDEKFSRDISDLKLDLLDVLATKFGYKSAVQASEAGLSFNLKANHEVELLKKR